ncbi:alpha-glucan family phosphorylase [Streptomyces sp. URMC 129]|uniref:alpha-glucan family phosphorylase n=1 Tax=Streptomyces sp. URMC 129 TaxID=3423407 RepID=UPI003F1AC7F6
MRAHRLITVPLDLPAGLAPLRELATNLRWTWHPPTRDLFAEAAPELWTRVGENPARLLTALSPGELTRLAGDETFLARMRERAADLAAYLDRPLPSGPTVAYFSPEFGITASLPLYSGGLGILAGDHLKSASDLGIPLIGVGLLYRSGYFAQFFDDDGWQRERYPRFDAEAAGLSPLADADVHLALPDGGDLFARVWVARVGRVPLLLLDSDDERNTPADRALTDRLYGGDTLTRLRQELLLGIGGVRAVRAYCDLSGSVEPDVYHTNEGHAGFLGLERVRALMDEAVLGFPEALAAVRAGTVFTTHTPVPAGIDRFDAAAVAAHLAAAVPGVPVDACLELGAEADPGVFNMAHMGLRLAQWRNGVSALHGSLSRSMFAPLWPELPVDQVPIGHVTNGVHAATWAAGGPAPDLGDDALWAARRELRAGLVERARRRLRAAHSGSGAGSATQTAWVDDCLDPDVLTIGFARRVPTYKRLTLMLSDRDRLRRLLLDPDRPVQLLVAGKAHPADDDGKKLIQELLWFARDPALRRRIVFLPDYDMAVGAELVAGCDVWLNNPLRPQEACGTSGMKAALNGGLNLSIGDGWWEECYDPAYGWAIPSAGGTDGGPGRDETEANALYDLLETKVVPLFYDDRPGWLRMVRAVLRDLRPRLLADRMVTDYVETLYRPAAEASERLAAHDFAPARRLAAWSDTVRDAWPGVRVDRLQARTVTLLPHDGRLVGLRAEVELGPLSPEDVGVLAYCGPVDDAGELVDPVSATMTPTADGTAYEAVLTPPHSGVLGCSARVLPRHELLGPDGLGLVRDSAPRSDQ